jgi:hypothetical protein
MEILECEPGKHRFSVGVDHNLVDTNICSACGQRICGVPDHQQTHVCMCTAGHQGQHLNMHAIKGWKSMGVRQCQVLKT